MTRHASTEFTEIPAAVGAAAEAVIAARHDAGELMRVFNRSPVPMVMVDGRRRYVEANRPARLASRLSLAELRGYTIDQLTPPRLLPTMQAVWDRLLATGCVAGPYEIAEPGGSKFGIVYYALAEALPGLHVIAFAPAGWPDDELGLARDDGRDGSPLTPREREILQLAAEGSSGPEIAERLVVSPGTVKTHFQNIYEKLGVSDRAAAVASGLRRGLVD